ncbi:ABC transporter ATP-binding protein [Sporolactobacillus nakayamae]|uniref:Carbohydrate ABC transporter ATP-binding protein, CUT1 family (TC 3.A.1.1.-) n=1 Tax=Sporolactobacillus nakayamae TaxID=269670 RepID=A0A1I2SS01_9BACL|nr:sn-glycerol-3-phosphate ABC transporter ATP-binding protein UgpC [Sporolactobacillus nakayamae]SFG55605.1 carbohydrate ABC transporter ATP-binding protein, CUT1 family (TC 3.A.1.1.-) [Sporolactobacillus nakayamae]
MASIVLNHIKKRYDNSDAFAVKDFQLEIKDKEFIVLVGPSGCGKSTTLRMIAGLEQISEGELYINDKKINDMAPKDRDIAMVFQNYALYPHMSVYGNMAFGLKIRKLKKSEIDQRVREAAKVLGLEDYLDRKPKALSGGQRQRVALGRAMVRNPQVFLMDEPLSNLDAKLRVQMRSEIAKLHRRLNVTTVYVTHDQTEAMTMADRIVIMKDGEIQQIGTPKEVYNNPANVFVGGFIGAPPMNFVPAIVSEVGVQINDHIISLPAETMDKLHAYIGKSLIVGIRPEDIEYVKSTEETAFTATIDVAELLGSESLLYINFEGNNLIVKIPAEDVRAGDTITLAFKSDKLRFFDSETETLIV